MAKRGRPRKAASLPNFVPGTPAVASTESSETTATVQTLRVTLELPVQLVNGKAAGPLIRRVDLQNLKPREQLALRALYDGLVYEGATVTTSLDRPVKHLASDPVRHILQQIASQLPA